jgi:dihydroxyacetone kinase-like predicted kinase
VAVCSGDGLAELFWQLGVQAIVTGGQTMNPSTAELLEAVDHVNADEVVILPNNKNIIPVAEQVDALSHKTVRVVPTQSMPEALAALVVYDPVADAASNADEMGDAASSVVTGEVTQAVRDVQSAGRQVTAGDWIGLVRGDGIVAVSGSLEGATIALLEHIVAERAEIVTIVEGAEAVAETTQGLTAWLSEHRPGAEVEVHRGGQPLYPYLIGVE